MINFPSCSARIRQVEKDILDKYLGSNYDTRIRPNGHHESGKICGEEASDDGNVEGKKIHQHAILFGNI